MRIKGYRNQNMMFGVKKLFAEINPATSKFLLKNNGVTIIMFKKDKKQWDQLPFKENKVMTKLFSLNQKKKKSLI